MRMCAFVRFLVVLFWYGSLIIAGAWYWAINKPKGQSEAVAGMRSVASEPSARVSIGGLDPQAHSCGCSDVPPNSTKFTCLHEAQMGKCSELRFVGSVLLQILPPMQRLRVGIPVL